MSNKPKSVPGRARRPKPARRDPKEQRAVLAKLIGEQSVQPVKNFDEFLEETAGVWPADENVDEFLVWLRQLRRGERV